MQADVIHLPHGSSTGVATTGAWVPSGDKRPRNALSSTEGTSARDRPIIAYLLISLLLCMALTLYNTLTRRKEPLNR